MRSENFLLLFPYFIVQISQCTFFLLLRLSEEEPNVSNGANLAGSTITTFAAHLPKDGKKRDDSEHIDDPGPG